MALIAGILMGVLLGLSYMRKGLFLGAMALISVLFATIVALAFGAHIARITQVESPYTLAASIAGLAVLVFAVLRGTMAFIDEEADFHPAVEHIGGAGCGLAVGLLLAGLASTCLACMPTPKPLAFAEPSFRQSSELALWPCNVATMLIPGQEEFDLDQLLLTAGREYSIYEPPAFVPPAIESDEDEPPSEDPAP